METKLLKSIGLTEGETKVYLALIRLGETKTGLLAKEARVSSSKVYKILDRLIMKGLVGSKIKGKTRYFTATNPEAIINYMEEKKKELTAQMQEVQKLVPFLQSEQQQTKQHSQATLYEGFAAIANFYKNILKDLKAGDEYYVIGAGYPEGKPEIRAFFYAYHQERAKHNIRVNMLMNYEVRGNEEATTRINSNVRFLPQYFITNMTIVFYKNKAFFFFLTERPTAFLLESKEAADSLKAYFNVLWKIAKR